MLFSTLDVGAALPEIVLAASALALLMLGAFSGEGSARRVTQLSILALVLTAVLVLTRGTNAIALNGLFRADGFATFMKVLALLGSALALLLSIDYFERLRINRFEYPVLVLFATIGMMLMISAGDLMSLYIGLELQSLSLYVVAAFHRDDRRSSEAGLKYFLLGALSSGMLLYGSSLVYGFVGSTHFVDIAKILGGQGAPSVGAVFGLVFVAAGLCFKISAVPFHMWTPDVYEGAPTPVTALFAAAPKVAAMSLLVRVMIGPFGGLIHQWQQIIVFVSIASMVLGSLAAINQTNIKRLMAYSSIGHMGYALVGLAAGTVDGVTGVAVYLAIYVVMSIGTFGCVIAMRRAGHQVETIADLAGLSRTNPGLALAFAIFMFSMAGIPPLGGFFSKLYVFMAAIHAGLFTLAIVGVLASVVGAYYYIRIVKVMYFDEPAPGGQGYQTMAPSVAVVTGVAAVAILLFVLMPSPLIDGAARAAGSLFGG